MAVKWKPNEIFFDRKTNTKTIKVFSIAGVKTSELEELCNKPDSDLRRLEKKLRVKARKELNLRKKKLLT